MVSFLCRGVSVSCLRAESKKSAFLHGGLGAQSQSFMLGRHMSDLCSHLCMITFWGGATNAAYDGILGFGL